MGVRLQPPLAAAVAVPSWTVLPPEVADTVTVLPASAVPSRTGSVELVATTPLMEAALVASGLLTLKLSVETTSSSVFSWVVCPSRVMALT